MGFIATFLHHVRAWDRTVKTGVVTALVMLVILLTLTMIAPQAARPAFLVGIVGVIIVAQVLIMWGNRHLVTPYAKAQQQFQDGDYAGARDTLLTSIVETEEKGKRPTVETLTLLGNAYRNLGLLGESEDILTTALQRQPQNPFPLYGFGRTLLAAGRFADAEVYFQRAMQAGGPEGMMFDVALAQILQGSSETFVPVLRRVSQDTTQDVTRRWLAEQLLPPEQRESTTLSTDEAQFGEIFWQNEIERFVSTPYGQMMKQILKPDMMEGR